MWYKNFVLFLLIFINFHQSTCAQEYHVLDFGAKGDGLADDTQAVWAALSAANRTNGGRVIFDSGYTFLTGGFNVSDNIILDIRGTILASVNASDYMIIPHNIHPWQYYAGKQPVVFMYNASNITITGGGLIDGQGPIWYACRNNSTQPPCFHNGSPRLVMPTFVSDLTIEHITLKDSPQWTLHLAYTTNVYINNITIVTPPGVLATRDEVCCTDGIDIDCSVNVTVENSFISSGDDAISIKSGVSTFGVEYGRATENVMVRNLSIGITNGISMGSEMASGARNITFRDIIINGSARAINVKTGTGQGGLIEDITYSNIQIYNTNLTIELNENVYNGHNWTTPVPIVKNVILSNITANNVEYAYYIWGVSAENPVQNVLFSNIHISNIKFNVTNQCQYIQGICDNTTVVPCPPCLIQESCFDAIDDCSQYLSLCNVGSYHNSMCTRCRKSCNLCNSC